MDGFSNNSSLGRLVNSTSTTRVVVCDDSAVIRSVLSRVLEKDDAISIVGRAANGLEVVRMFRADPDVADVLILDIEMPSMDGLTALPLLMAAAPGLRVIIASTLTTHGASATLEALRLGAIDYVPKTERRRVIRRCHLPAGTPS